MWSPIVQVAKEQTFETSLLEKFAILSRNCDKDMISKRVICLVRYGFHSDLEKNKLACHSKKLPPKPMGNKSTDSFSFKTPFPLSHEFLIAQEKD